MLCYLQIIGLVIVCFQLSQKNSAVLDSGCSFTVAGLFWMDYFLQTFCSGVTAVQRFAGTQNLSFGGREFNPSFIMLKNGQTYFKSFALFTSIEQVIFPFILARKKVNVKTRSRQRHTILIKQICREIYCESQKSWKGLGGKHLKLSVKKHKCRLKVSR